jgi:predicted dehydrogenase
VRPTDPRRWRPRLGVIGARRRRQGTGSHLARFAHEAGGRIVAVAGSSGETAAEASHALVRWGIEATPYADAQEMVAQESLDALVVASPVAFHERHLRLALEANLHALCEKPLLWRPTGLSEVAAEIFAAFRDRGLHLACQAQWPKTLPAYASLFPVAMPPARFDMAMAPAVTGYEALVESVPHPLSLLEEVREAAGFGEHADAAPLSRLRIDRPDGPSGGDRRLVVSFGYPLPDGREIDARVALETREEPPRPASYGFDGNVVHREIEEPGYRLFLRADATDGASRRVPLEDPSRRLVTEFVAAISQGPAPPPSRRLEREVRRLEEVLAAWSGPRPQRLGVARPVRPPRETGERAG